MRQAAIIVATAVITAILTLWGASVIDASPPMRRAMMPTTAPAAASIDVMQMTLEAKDLREQHYSMF